MTGNLERILKEIEILNGEFSKMLSDHELIYQKGEVPTKEQKEELSNLCKRQGILEEKLWNELSGKNGDNIII